uniref:Uncharacterized protein n=1 Tax=Megaselia scalaris TaxID=36166 RepID=T1GI12_MEGSC
MGRLTHSLLGTDKNQRTLENNSIPRIRMKKLYRQSKQERNGQRDKGSTLEHQNNVEPHKT